MWQLVYLFELLNRIFILNGCPKNVIYDLVYVLDLDFMILPCVATSFLFSLQRRFEGSGSIKNIIIDLTLSAFVYLVCLMILF